MPTTPTQADQSSKDLIVAAKHRVLQGASDDEILKTEIPVDALVQAYIHRGTLFETWCRESDIMGSLLRSGSADFRKWTSSRREAISNAVSTRNERRKPLKKKDENTELKELNQINRAMCSIESLDGQWEEAAKHYR